MLSYGRLPGQFSEATIFFSTLPQILLASFSRIFDWTQPKKLEIFVLKHWQGSCFMATFDVFTI